MASAPSRQQPCQILYSWSIFVLRTVTFMFHIQDTAYSTTSSPQKPQHSSCLKVLLEGERWYPASLWIWHLLLYPKQGHQSGKLIPVYQLLVVHHVIHHHSSEIPIWKIGMVCAVSCPDCHTLFEGRELAVAHPIHLKIEEERTLMPNVTSQVTKKIVKTKRSDQSPHLP